MQSKEEIFVEIRNALIELFEIDESKITLSARLNEELEIDSIDAVDLLDRLCRHYEEKISVESFRSVRTVGDLVEAVYALVKA